MCVGSFGGEVVKIIVISDSHGKSDRIEQVLEMHKNADAFFFLGDGLRDVFGKERLHRGGLFAAVRGNCDVFSAACGENYPEEYLIRVGEYNILMMHGHTKGVKHGLDRAVSYASLRGADILLYGHTHIPMEKYLPEGTETGEGVLEKPMWVFNPGSLGAYGGDASYGLIEIRGKNVLMSHGRIK